MGLGVSHGCWSGNYAAFKLFREEVADAARKHDGYEPDYSNHPDRAFFGWWDEEHNYDDPLDVFFVHSDCEGWIFPQDAGKVADRLEVLVGYLSDDEAAPFWKSRKTLWQFIKGLREAADEWDVVSFY